MGGPNITGFLDLLDRKREREQQISAAGKSADYFTQADPEFLPALNLTPEGWKNLGAVDKAGSVTAYLQRKTMQRQAEQQNIERQRLQLEQARANQVDQEMGAEQAFQNALSRTGGAGGAGGEPDLPAMGSKVSDAFGRLSPFTTGPAQPRGAGRTLAPMDMLRLGLQSGVRPDRIATLADSMARIQTLQDQGTQGLPFTFEEDPITGTRFARIKNTVLPSGVNPKATSNQIEDVHDEQGNVIGQATRDPKTGKLMQWKAGEEGTVEVPDPDNPVFGARVRLPLRVVKKDYPHLLKGLEPGATKAADIAPEKARDRKANTIYQTPMGPMKWTGTGWLKP